MKKGRKSHYYRFFISHMLVLLVPLMTIAIVFAQSQNNIRKQITISSQNILQYFWKCVDGVFEGAESTCIALAYNETVQNNARMLLERFDKRAYYTWSIAGRIKENKNDIYEDVFIYFPEKDYVVSDYYSLPLEQYYDICYSAEGDFLEEFRNVASCKYKKPTLCSMNGSDEESYLCIAMRYGHSKNVAHDYVVVIVLDRNYISDLLRDMENISVGGVTAILDNDKKIIFTSEPQLINAGTKIDVDNHSSELILESNKYVIQSQKSKITDAHYIYAVPWEYYWSELSKLYKVSVIGIVISIMVGILIVLRQTKKSYRPIGDIVNNLEKQIDIPWDAMMKSEFEFVKDIFDEERYKLSKANNKISILQKDMFVCELLNGCAQTEQENIDDFFEENGIVLCSEYFGVVLFQIYDIGTLDANLAEFIIDNVFKELCQEKFNVYCVVLSADCVAALVNYHVPEEYEECCRFVEMGNAFWQQIFSLKSTVGISTVQLGMNGIHTAYKQAMEALSYSYLLGKNTVIRYEQVAEREFLYEQVNESKLQNIVMGWLEIQEDNRQQTALELVEQVLADYGIGEKSSLEMVECFKFEVLSMFQRVTMQYGLWNTEWKDDVLKLLDRETLDDFKELSASLLVRLYAERKESEAEDDICEMVIAYIGEHYMEEQLSLTILGKEFGISSKHLSRVFREKYEFSVLDYIANIRISKSKVLLKDTDMTIQKIAENCGFVNSNSFIRTFKKQEGITPGKYRQLCNIE